MEETKGRKKAFTVELQEKACELKEDTDFTDREIIKELGIGKTTFYDELRNNSEFSANFKKAEKKRLKTIGQICRQIGFKRLTEGQEVEEETIEMGKRWDEDKKKYVEFQKSKKTVKKRVVASDQYLMYAQNNLDPDNFKHKDHIDITSKDEQLGIPVWMEDLPEDVLEKVLEAKENAESRKTA